MKEECINCEHCVNTGYWGLYCKLTKKSVEKHGKCDQHEPKKQKVK